MTAPYGSWPTPFTSALVVADAVRLGELAVDGDDVLWAEGRPAEGGRTRARAPSARRHLRRPAARRVQRAHGRPRVRRRGVVGARRRRLVRQLGRPAALPARARRRPAAAHAGARRRRAADRFADGDLAPDGRSIVCVRERHAARRPPRSSTRSSGSTRTRRGARRCWSPASTSCRTPRLARTAAVVAWLEWNHPTMPWDGTELVVRDLGTGEEIVVAGGPSESVLEPRLGRRTARCGSSPTAPTGGTSTASSPGTTSRRWSRMDAEIGVPQWVFGPARYAALGRRVGRVRAQARRVRRPRPADPRRYDRRSRHAVHPGARRCAPRPTARWSSWPASPTQETGVHRVDPHVGVVETLRPPRDLGVDPAFVSVPEPIDVPLRRRPHRPRALLPARHPELNGPEGELPPLIVEIHGGPTAVGRGRLSTRRPVLDEPRFRRRRRQLRRLDRLRAGVPRAARRRNGASSTSTTAWPRRGTSPRVGRVDGGAPGDPGRLGRRLHHARGLVRDDTPFAAGADHFGVADLEALARDTHKFESRYLDRLVGPYPAARDVYVERSPIHHVERFEPAADRPAGQRGRDRAARAERDDRRRAA